MKPTGIRRWLVPGAALAAMAGPLLLGGCPFEGPVGFSDCEACAYCYETPRAEDPFREPPEKEPTAPQGAEAGQPENTERPPPRPTGNHIPDAVTRPKIDPDLRVQPGYAPPQNPAPKGKY